MADSSPRTSGDPSDATPDRPPSAVRPPSVDALARALADEHGLLELPHALRVEAARAGIAGAIAAGEPGATRRYAIARAHAIQRALLGPVINATGVLLHTNLGRAPISAWRSGGSGLAPVRYGNVEFDVDTGRRGSRRDHGGPLLARLCGAESAIIVNNCAAAVTLVLAALAQGRDAFVSRGELVEIGGGFRIPDVMEQSGARLVEVGTTNRTRLADYQRAVERSPDPALVLKIHQSNYRITGFTEETPLAALATLGVPVAADIGSGLLDTATPWLADPSGQVPTLPWLAGEPAARQSLAAGAGLVLFSGDKLLGGPQAGIIAGRADLVEVCARHPLYRAFRPGALVLEALQNTAMAYLRATVRDDIPFWRMACVDLDLLRARAAGVLVAANSPRPYARDGGLNRSVPVAAAGLSDPAPPARAMVIVETEAVPGGGTLPGVTIASVGIAVDGDFTEQLRRAEPPIVARVDAGRTILDLRTIDPADDAMVAHALRCMS